MAKKKTQKKARILNAEEAAKNVEIANDIYCDGEEDDLVESTCDINELDVGVANALANYYGEYLRFDGLKAISDKAAEALAKFKGDDYGSDLYLNGLRTLSDKAAKALAKFKGNELYLNGLQTISDSAGETLAKFKGGLLRARP